MRKRVVGFFAALLLCLGALPGVALAEGYSLWVNGVQVTTDNASDVLGDADEGATVTYDAASNTLTLDGATLDTTYGSNSPDVVYYTGKGELTVKVENNNTIKNENAVGIWSTSGGNIKLTGTGSLTVKTGESTVAGAGVTIDSGTYDFTSSDGNSVYAYSSDITITGTANVAATGYYGIVGKNVTVSGSATVDTTSTADCGIYTSGTLDISDNADVTAKGNYAALRGDTGVDISGGTVYAEAEDTAIWGYSCDVSITGGTVTAVSSDSSAISAQGSLTISGEGTVVDATSDASGYSAICSTKTLTISDGAQVSAIGSKSSGIDGYDDIVITGANTSVTATNGAIDGAAIIGRGNIKISNGADVDASGSGSGIYTTSNEPSDTVEITGSTVQVRLDDPSAQYGIYANSGVSIFSSWVDATEKNSDITAGDSVLFTGSTGKVYGDASVPGDVEIPEGKTLNVPEESSLTVPADTTLTNKGTLAVASKGSVTNEGTIVGDIQNAGTVTNEGIIQGSVTGKGGTLTNNGGITQGGDSLQVTSRDALQKMIGASVGKAEPVSITLTADIAGDLTIPVGANVVIDGARSYTINGSITCTTSENASDVTNLTFQNLTLDGSNVSSGMAVISQNQGSGSPKELTGVNGLNLTLDGCTVQNYTKKALYLTNAKTLTVTGCTFQDNATGAMGDPNISGDYTIDLNLCGVQGTVVNITGSTFSGDCGDKSVIKMAVRGGASDASATDVPLNSTQGNAVASAESLTISGCTFQQAGDIPAVNIGTDSKEDANWTGGEFAENTTGAFAVTISNNKTDVSVFEANKAYKTSDGKYCLASGEGTTEAENLTVPAGRTASKSADGELAVQPLPTPGPTTYSVTVAEAENGEVAVDKTSASAGEKVTVTATPDEGHGVASVSVTCGDEQVDVTDNGDGTYAFEMPAGDVTVTVTFGASAPALPFTDVSDGDWYHGAVAFVYSKGLMTGYDGTTLFGPEDALGREQAAAVLHRALGAGEHAGDCGLADVVQSEWYAQAVNWAVETGLMAGYGDGSGLFGVGDALTRDQFAAIVARVAGADLSKADPSALDAFSDGDEVAGWAVPAVSWAVQAGILEGSPDGDGGTELRSSADITRGEMAAMVMRAAEAGLLPAA